jgi:hypothetical protein
VIDLPEHRREIEGVWRRFEIGEKRGSEEGNQGREGGVIWEPFRHRGERRKWGRGRRRQLPERKTKPPEVREGPDRWVPPVSGEKEIKE